MISPTLKNNYAKYLPSRFFFLVFTPPRSHEEIIIFTAVCLCVCLCVCLSVCMSGSTGEQIHVEQIHLFGNGFRSMVAYNNGSDPIEIGHLGSKVKVTVT